VVFAEETMKRVKDKLTAMKQSVGLTCITTFDYNEKIVLTKAIQLYTVNLLLLPPHPRQAWELRQCYKLAAHFAVESSKAT
jgi:hypothetical protein